MAAMARSRAKRLRMAIAVLVVLAWLGLAAIGVTYAAFRQVSGWASCEHERGDSNYGEFSWSAIPPGPVCTWTLAGNGFDDSKGPTPVMSLWLLSLVGLGVAAVWAIRTASRYESPIEPEPIELQRTPT